MTCVPLSLSIYRQIHIDLYLPGGKRFNRSLDLFSEIDPDTSSFKVLGTKVWVYPQSFHSRSFVIFLDLAAKKDPNYV